MSESSLQHDIIAALEAAGAYVCNVVHAGRDGTPDLLVCSRGQFIALEIKLPGRRADPLQQVEAQRVHRAGGLAAVIHSVDEALAAVADADNWNPSNQSANASASSR